MIAKLLNNAIIKYPYQWADFMADNNNTQGLNPADLLVIFPLTTMGKQGYSVVEVQPTPQPFYDPITQDCTEGTPSLTNGVWVQTWGVTTASATEQAQRIKAQAQTTYNALIAGGTVKRVLEGISLGTCAATNADVQAYMNYRRALRAILSQAQPATIPTALPTEPPHPAGT
ncbi:MAG: hypothetical protein KGL63_13790 [Betaproteobacteria bacterium]|nr:hypothetical protein [Betaproteobacteria bacterium]